jgi:hypothetical protein
MKFAIIAGTNFLKLSPLSKEVLRQFLWGGGNFIIFLNIIQRRIFMQNTACFFKSIVVSTALLSVYGCMNSGNELGSDITEPTAHRVAAKPDADAPIPTIITDAQLQQLRIQADQAPTTPLGKEIVSVRQKCDPKSVDVELNKVYAKFGMKAIESSSTVVQQNQSKGLAKTAANPHLWSWSLDNEFQFSLKKIFRAEFYAQGSGSHTVTVTSDWQTTGVDPFVVVFGRTDKKH